MPVRSIPAVFAALCLVIPACNTPSKQAPEATAPQERLFEVVSLEYAQADDLIHPLNDVFAGSTMRVQADERTNSLLLAGKPDEMARAKMVVSRLDVEVVSIESQVSVEVIALKSARATDVRKSLQGVLEKRTAQIATDERTNSLLIRAAPASMARIKDLIAQLDREQ